MPNCVKASSPLQGNSEFKNFLPILGVMFLPFAVFLAFPGVKRPLCNLPGSEATEIHSKNRTCNIPWPFLSRKPPGSMSSINCRKSAINPKIASVNVCQRPIFCDFPSFSVEIVTAPPPFRSTPTRWTFRHNFRQKKGQGI